MKVLSIKEPYATLIMEKKKFIETRSFKTNYRGELYIHASSMKSKKSELMNLLDNKELNYEKIICKCNLVDCIYMTKEYVEKMKKNNYQEYICGVYEEGRYAWVLEDITPLQRPIWAKGFLGIWNYYDEFEIMQLMDNINYGWVDKNNNKHMIVDELFSKNYILQEPKETIVNQIGVCWDQVELERYYFKSYKIRTYFIVYDDGNKCPTHTFLMYEKNAKYYWFEHAWEKFKGIHEYKTQKELLLDVRNKFIKYELNRHYDEEKLRLVEYEKPKYHISVQDFYDYCGKKKNIDWKTLFTK